MMSLKHHNLNDNIYFEEIWFVNLTVSCFNQSFHIEIKIIRLFIVIEVNLFFLKLIFHVMKHNHVDFYLIVLINHQTS